MDLTSVVYHDSSHQDKKIAPAYLHHLMNVTLWSCKLCRILDFYQNYEVQIVPHVVLRADVLLECDVFVVEGLQDIIRSSQVHTQRGRID